MKDFLSKVFCPTRKKSLTTQSNAISSQYGADYFERGIQTGTSLYENYHWIPHLTIPMVMTIIDYLGIKRGESVLDIGCAKGYMVKAFRWLGRDAYGYDISEYALDHADAEIKPYLSDGLHPVCKFAIAKDVLEHFTEDEVVNFLTVLSSDILFAIIPLGDGKKFNIPHYELDITHRIRRPFSWWQHILNSSGWEILEAKYRVPGIKDNWSYMLNGNIFITAKGVMAMPHKGKDRDYPSTKGHPKKGGKK